MIANLIGGFIAILLGTALIGPVSTEVMSVASTTNSTGSTCTYAVDSASTQCALYLSSAWGASVLRLVPGFFALSILGMGIAVTYTSLRQAGIV
jgi:hypothetical protein